MKGSQIATFCIGPISSAIFGLATVPVMAHIFTPEDIGRLNVLQIVVSFGLLIFVLGMDQAYVREFSESNEQPALLKACFLPGFALLLLAGIISLPYSNYVAFMLFGVRRPAYYVVTLICLIVSFLSRFLSLTLRMEGRGLSFSIGQLFPKAAMFLLICVAAMAPREQAFETLQLMFLSSLLGALIVIGWSARQHWRRSLRVEFEWAASRSALKFGAPLIFTGAAYWGLSATSVLALRSTSTFSEVGVYSVSMSFAGIATVLQSAFSVVWAPVVYKWVAEGKDARLVDNVARQILAVVCLILVCCGMFAWAVDYILPSDYSGVKYLIPCAAMQPLLYTLSEVTCVGINIARRTVLSVWATLAALSVNVLLAFVFVPKYGAAGAAVSNSLAYAVFFVARTEASIYAWRSFPRVRLYVSVVAAVALSILTVVFSRVGAFSPSWIWLCVLPALAYYFRAEFSEMSDFVRRTLFARATTNRDEPDRDLDVGDRVDDQIGSGRVWIGSK